jgi:hypothetical protein
MRYGDALRDSTHEEVEDVERSSGVGDNRVARSNEPNLRPRQQREADWAPEPGESANTAIAPAIDLSDGPFARVCDEDAAAVD